MTNDEPIDVAHPDVLSAAHPGPVMTSPRDLLDAALPRGTETILLVEDDQQVRRLTHLILEGAGYRVLVAEGGEEALRIANADGGQIQLLLADVVLPGGDGHQIALALAPTHPDLKVVYMSGYTDDVLAQHGIADDGAGFLQKPFLPRALAEKIREALDE